MSSVSSYVRVLSERVMKSGFEGYCANLMGGVQSKVTRMLVGARPHTYTNSLTHFLPPKFQSPHHLQVKTYPGLLEYETLQDAHDHHKYVVMTTWKSEAHLETWCCLSPLLLTPHILSLFSFPSRANFRFRLADPEYLRLTEKLEKVLLEKPTYRVLRQPKEDIFLL
jgi:hypothetical protein